MTAEMPMPAHRPSLFDRANFAPLLQEEVATQPPEAAVDPSIEVLGDAQALPAVIDELQTPNETAKSENWLSRNKFKLALGALVTSVVATAVKAPGSDMIQHVIETLPWAAPAFAASEAAWIGGMAMMAVGAGTKVGNPFTLHGRGEEIMADVNNSKTFKAGFWINAAGAVGTAGVVGAAVVSGLPPESWGVLGLPAADLAATLAARKVVLGRLHESEIRVNNELHPDIIDVQEVLPQTALPKATEEA